MSKMTVVYWLSKACDKPIIRNEGFFIVDRLFPKVPEFMEYKDNLNFFPKIKQKKVDYLVKITLNEHGLEITPDSVIINKDNREF